MLAYLDQRNKDSKPFVWTADANLILGKVARLSKRSSDSGQDTSAALLRPAVPILPMASTAACSQRICQWRRRTDTRKPKVLSGPPEYRQVCRESARKWRPDPYEYWRQYRGAQDTCSNLP
jgi:hypothetical protein